MNPDRRELKVWITLDERKELDKYLMGYPHGQLSYILRHAIRMFIAAEKAKETESKEVQGGYPDREGRRAKAAQTDIGGRGPRRGRS